MRRFLWVVPVVLVAAACGGSGLTTSEQQRAVSVVEREWAECLEAAGTSVAGATVSETSETQQIPGDAGAKPATVTLTTGEQFVVQLEGTLRGARVANGKATATLDAANSVLGDGSC